MKNVGASVLDKLKNTARSSGVAMPTLLRRYVQERLLYRLSISESASSFCLKGGVLLAAYNDGDLLRPTEDIDFSGYDGDGNVAKLEATVRAVIAIDILDDGVVFQPETIRILKDRQGIVPGGKVSMTAMVGTAKVNLLVDVGFGNAITPDARPLEIPTLLDGTVPRPTIKAYPLETVIAEKLHAMAQFGRANTRLKDHYDLLWLLRIHEFDGPTLVDAVTNTFRHQEREIPAGIACLDEQFAEANEKAWQAFLKKVNPELDRSLGDTIADILYFVEPILGAARGEIDLPGTYQPNTGWSAPNPSSKP